MDAAAATRLVERLGERGDGVVHEYVALDLDRVVEALKDLTAVERFASVVAAIERL